MKSKQVVTGLLVSLYALTHHANVEADQTGMYWQYYPNRIHIQYGVISHTENFLKKTIPNLTVTKNSHVRTW